MTIKIGDLFEMMLGANRLNKPPSLGEIRHSVSYRYKKFSALNDESLIIDDNDVENIEWIYVSKELEKNMFLKKEWIFMKTILPLKTFYVDTNKEFIVPSLYCILIPKQKSLDKYNITSKDIWAYLNSKTFEKEISKTIQGTNIFRNLNINIIKNFEIDIKNINNKKSELFYKKEKLNKLVNRKLKLTNVLVNKIVKGK